MTDTLIRKDSSHGSTPCMQDYGKTYGEFSWKDARAQLSGLPDGAINIAHEAIDKHGKGSRKDHVALRWMSNDTTSTDYTYGQLSELSNRFANVLTNLGIQKGDRMFSLSGRVPPLYIGVLGALKTGAVFSPLFSAFGPEPIRQRMTQGSGRVLLTSKKLYEDKIAAMRSELPALEFVILATDSPGESQDLPEGTLDFWSLIQAASPDFEVVRTQPEDLALLHFTSGTTGAPKGAMHVHQAIVAHHITGQFALDLHPEDIFWCTADPGWVTGTSYGIISPLSNGVTMLVDQAEFNAERWYKTLQDQHVTVWYTAPTAIRMLMKAGPEIAKKYDLSKLRFIASVGEPLNPEAVVWGQEVLGLPIHDNWWQSETGGIMIANYASMDIKPGSMGKPLPGIEAAIVERMGDGTIRAIEEPNKEGELALKPGWPSMFRGYLDMNERYEKAFSGGWYLTGDVARKDEDGYFFFVGRADDLIKSSGHLIGPFEVESALIEHPAITQAAVIGKPHPLAGEIVKAFVELANGIEATPELKKEIMAFARKRLGSAVAPREIEILDEIPRTRSGKIMRRLLKARELGLPEGDLSTLEGKSND